MKKHPDFREHFREGQIGIKTFNSLSKEEKNNHLQSILALPKTSRTTVDEHILKFHSVLPLEPVKHFISIEE